MSTKQQLKKDCEEVKQWRSQAKSLKAKSSEETGLIQQLTGALEALKHQYEDMLNNSDKVIAAQAERIKKLESEKRTLRRQLEEFKKSPR